jgi:hypothetical protein
MTIPIPFVIDNQQHTMFGVLNELLNAPQPGVYIKTLRKAYDAYLTNADLNELLSAVQTIARDTDPPGSVTTTESKTIVRREDLKLICFDYVW